MAGSHHLRTDSQLSVVIARGCNLRGRIISTEASSPLSTFSLAARTQPVCSLLLKKYYNWCASVATHIITRNGSFNAAKRVEPESSTNKTVIAQWGTLSERTRNTPLWLAANVQKIWNFIFNAYRFFLRKVLYTFTLWRAMTLLLQRSWLCLHLYKYKQLNLEATFARYFILDWYENCNIFHWELLTFKRSLKLLKMTIVPLK